MASVTQVSKTSENVALLESGPFPQSSTDQTRGAVISQIIHSDPCRELQIKKRENGEIELEEFKTAYATACSLQGPSSSRKILAFGALLKNREITRFIFEEIYSTPNFFHVSEIEASRFLIFCSNPEKAEEGIDIIERYAEEGNFPAMVHLATYLHSFPRSQQNCETRREEKKVADYLIDRMNYTKLNKLPTQLLIKALDCCLRVSKKEVGYLAGRRAIHASWLTSCCPFQTAKVSTLIGYCLEFGIGFEKDDDKAYHYYDEGAKLKNGVALERLARYHLKAEECNLAFEYLGRAAHRNIASAQLALISLFSKDNIYKKEAFGWIETAADLGVPEAIRILSRLQENGFGVEKRAEENKVSE